MLRRKPFLISGGVLHLCTMNIQTSFIAFSKWRREQILLVNRLGIEKEKIIKGLIILCKKTGTRDRINIAVTKINFVAVITEEYYMLHIKHYTLCIPQILVLSSWKPHVHHDITETSLRMKFNFLEELSQPKTTSPSVV